MGRVVNLIGRGGQCFAEEVLGWNRVTVRKGQAELRNGTTFDDRFSARGRRRAEEHLPDLLNDIRSIMEPLGKLIQPSAAPVSIHHSAPMKCVFG